MVAGTCTHLCLHFGEGSVGVGRYGFGDAAAYALMNLPRFGLPFEAKATIDARNLFDLQTTIENGETSLKLNTQRRILRGGISVRF